MAIYENSYDQAEVTIKSNWQKNASKPLLFAKVATKFGEKFMLDYTESEFRPGLELIEDYHSRLDDICLTQADVIVESEEEEKKNQLAAEDIDSTDESSAASTRLGGVDDHRAVEIAYRVAVRVFLTGDNSDHRFVTSERAQIDKLLSGVEQFVNHSPHPSRAEFISLIERILDMYSPLAWQSHRGEQPSYAISLAMVVINLGNSVLAGLELVDAETQAKGTTLRYTSANDAIDTASGMIQSGAVDNDVQAATSAFKNSPDADLTQIIPLSPYDEFSRSSKYSTPYPQNNGIQPLADDATITDLTQPLAQLPRWAVVALVASYLSRSKEMLKGDWLEDTFEPVLQHLTESAAAALPQAYDTAALEQKLDLAASSPNKNVDFGASLAQTALSICQADPAQIPPLVCATSQLFNAIAILNFFDTSDVNQKLCQEVRSLYKLAASKHWDDRSSVAMEDVAIFWEVSPEFSETQDKKGCFIATACYESDDHPNVQVLRQWRDQSLMQTILGRAFVRTYYALSPPLANWLLHHPLARDIVRDKLIAPIAKRIVRAKGSRTW